MKQRLLVILISYLSMMSERLLLSLARLGLKRPRQCGIKTVAGLTYIKSWASCSLSKILYTIKVKCPLKYITGREIFAVQCCPPEIT